MVLLHAMAALAADVRVNFRAIDVDHGLQAASAPGRMAAPAACRAAGVPVEILSLGLVPSRGASVEAAARRGVMRRSRRCSTTASLLTAHDRDDQLETVLIQLLRGSA